MTADRDALEVFACALLRDAQGRILIVAMGTDDHQHSQWWLPGAQVLREADAHATVRAVLSLDLGIRQPQIHGLQGTSAEPSPDEPGQMILLFDCGEIRDADIDRSRLCPEATIQHAHWATLAQVRSCLVAHEAAAVILALQHQPAGYYQHVHNDWPPAAAAPDTGPINGRGGPAAPARHRGIQPAGTGDRRTDVPRHPPAPAGRPPDPWFGSSR